MTFLSSDNSCSGGGIITSLDSTGGMISMSPYSSSGHHNHRHGHPNRGGLFSTSRSNRYQPGTWSLSPLNRSVNNRQSYAHQGGFFSMSRNTRHQNQHVESGLQESQPRIESGPSPDYTVLEESEAPEQPPPAYSPRQSDNVAGGHDLSQASLTLGARTSSPSLTLKPVFKPRINHNAQARYKVVIVIVTLVLVCAVIGIIVGVAVAHRSSTSKSNIPSPTYVSSPVNTGPDEAVTAGPVNAQSFNGFCQGSQEACASENYALPAGTDSSGDRQWTHAGR